MSGAAFIDAYRTFNTVVAPTCGGATTAPGTTRHIQMATIAAPINLAPGTYWSRSTVGEDEAFVVDAGSGEASQWLKMEPNGRVVCVRPRPS